jgi:predicted metal-dependent HD superfamily phosphohydrolase
MVRDLFIDTACRYTTPEQAIAHWDELEACYHEAGRHYHTLTHLEHVLHELLPQKHSFTHWHTLVFAAAYHDAIYNPLKNDNEEKSATLAVKRLTEINFPEPERIRCMQFILATKKHAAADAETDLFTDADLSILGAAPDAYMLYTQQVRREYAMYPDFLYKPGRKKVLRHFLGMESIYKTESFRNRYEVRAKANLKRELEMLTG